MAPRTKPPALRDLKVYSVKETAELLGKHPDTIREWCRVGIENDGLRALKGRGRNGKFSIPAEAIEEWIARHYYNPAAR